MASNRRLLFEEELKEAGNKLLGPPTSVDLLLPLLDHVGHLLSRVEQSPSKSIQEVITPITGALVSDVLVRHYDVDVKVAVALCMCEILRIKAPDPPYDDAKMKVAFKLILSAFEGLYDNSSRSYNKRVHILISLACIKSCVIMLDLECDALIVEMFKLFLANIRDYHPGTVFSSMKTIMALVLDESDYISSEILTPLLACLKKGNQEILPIAVKLAEKVFEKCAAKLRPCLTQGTVSLGDYTDVVTAVCVGCPAAIEHPNENASTGLDEAYNLLLRVQKNAISMDADENVYGPPSSVVADENVSEPETVLKCAELPKQIDHPMHPQHPLLLLARPPYESKTCECQGCKKSRENSVYHCSSCKFDIDVLCALLEDEAVTIPSHHHPVRLIRRPASFKCNACDDVKVKKNESYMCTKASCLLWIHKKCGSLRETFKRPDHDHPLVLATSVPAQV